MYYTKIHIEKEVYCNEPGFLENASLNEIDTGRNFFLSWDIRSAL